MKPLALEIALAAAVLLSSCGPGQQEYDELFEKLRASDKERLQHLTALKKCENELGKLEAVLEVMREAQAANEPAETGAPE